MRRRDGGVVEEGEGSKWVGGNWGKREFILVIINKGKVKENCQFFIDISLTYRVFLGK